MCLLRSKTLLVLIFLCIPLFACKEKGEASSPVLVRVDNRTVTLDQFRREFAKTLPAGQELSADEKNELERAFLVQVIDQELTLAEAERLQIKVTPAEVDQAIQEYRAEYPDRSFDEVLRERGISFADWRQELERGLLVEKVMRQAVDVRIGVSEAEIDNYYREHQDEFNRPDQVRARQIVVGSQEEGERVLALLQQGRPFAAVAKEFSLSPDAEQGGDLGFFARGEMPPEFDKVVFTLAKGRISDLVRSEYGYHIFLVEERRPAQRLSLDQVRDRIRDELLADRQEQAYQSWLQELRSRAKIDMNWSLL
ncbi:peptidylprolyl isomerase [Desulfuromonas carbonis]|uniref:peptidylprolyl isomerase n=1 Tax=Desulfuromonas sp. DDH964 TaxID=1823759 RepID=UPI00078E9BC9|nr:peptidyl-prolyl cis-trans isomerase [Desulfuromonas sp. DDH964]AMV73944.1 peptidylprolyl cis-trans isomerase lipoprotein, PpiC-type [Desulfuromonas sp. DDH964]